MFDGPTMCRSILEIFNSSKGEPGEVSKYRNKDTKSVAGLSEAELVDEQLEAELAELVQLGEH